ncbi:histidine acid phosphatase [Apiospora marii]|uniref:histidine acid phosphatase n=1 Tax=Apiospora marii TaxID=335849 RepID=UPI00312F22E1
MTATTSPSKEDRYHESYDDSGRESLDAQLLPSSAPPLVAKKRATRSKSALIYAAIISVAIITILAFLGVVRYLGWGGEHLKWPKASSSVPDYFQTTTEVLPGPTKTAAIAPFLAQTNTVAFTGTWAPNQPLQTGVPIEGNVNNSNIFQLQGHLSSYFAHSEGFGVDEHPLPPGAKISQMHLLHRHGSRYPTGESSISDFAAKVENLTRTGKADWSGRLSFLKDWKYTLGAEILVARGRQELFDSGVLQYYNYGSLYNTSTKILARTTSQDRMLKSAEYFMAGFFGLEWTRNVTLEPILETFGLNNSLAGYFACENALNFRSQGGNNASRAWEHIYLADATERLRKFTGDYDWTVADSYNAQTLCPYETVAYGFSRWCDLFTYEEWLDFEYSIDLQFQGGSGFQSPTGRAVGIGFVEEFHARLQGHLYDLPEGATNVNYTLDTMDETFPLHQDIYFDFSHDTNIYSVITAFGLKQFSDQLPSTHRLEPRNVTISHITPFAAKMVWEVITAPHPVKAQRPDPSKAASQADSYYDEGDATKYVHLTLSQRTVPLGESYPECGRRDDGWCEMGTFMQILDGLLEQAKFEYSCFGNYTGGSNVTDGVPVVKRALGGGMGSGLAQFEASDHYWL